MSERLGNLPQRQDGQGLDLMPLVLERLHAVDPELIEAVAEARAEGHLLAAGATESIAADAPRKPEGSSLALTHLPYAHTSEFDHPGLLQVTVYDWVDGNYVNIAGPATSVTSRLRLEEDGNVGTAMVLHYLTAKPGSSDSRATKVDTKSVPIISGGMPVGSFTQVRELYEGAGNPAKIRARAIEMAHMIVERSRFP